MHRPPTSLDGLRLAAAGVLAAALGACVFVVQSSCTTSTHHAHAPAEAELCRLRLLAAAIEEVTPELQAPEGSIRAELEAAQDRFCLELMTGEGGAR